MSKAANGNVLVLGDDIRIFLAVVRALGRAGKNVHAVCFDDRSPALKSKYVSKVHMLPNYSVDSNAWLQSLLHILQQNNIDLLIPCTDPWIIMLNMHRRELNGFNLAIPNPVEMEDLFDKELTHELCKTLGVATVKARRLRQSDNQNSLIGEFGLPLVIKPRRSYWLDQLDTWGRVYIVETAPELQDVLMSIKDHDRYLVESYFEGQGCGISILAEDGDILQAFQHRRLREGRGGSSSYRISESLRAGMLKDCEKISIQMKHTGVCMFEFRINDAHKKWVLLEINARFWGSMALPLSLGLDFPNLLYDLLVNGQRRPQKAYKAGIRSRNIFLDGWNLLSQLKRMRPNRILPWLAGITDFCLQPVRWIAGLEYTDSFVLDDPKPALYEILSVLKLQK